MFTSNYVASGCSHNENLIIIELIQKRNTISANGGNTDNINAVLQTFKDPYNIKSCKHKRKLKRGRPLNIKNIFYRLKIQNF